eukprot:Hpha_TRINITY_DN6718_c0_g1::TRINITY_DN6718_c0_g1_i1::g.111031::m.111031
MCVGVHRRLMLRRCYSTHPTSQQHTTHVPQHSQQERTRPPNRGRRVIMKGVLFGDVQLSHLHKACHRCRLDDLCEDVGYVVKLSRDSTTRGRLQKVLGVISEVVARREHQLHYLGPRHLQLLVYGYAKARQRDPRVFKCVAGAAQWKLEEFNAQNIALSVWAYAKAQQQATVLFDGIAKEAAARVGELKGQDLANTVWAFATAQRDAPALFEAVGREAQNKVGEFNRKDLANVV